MPDYKQTTIAGDKWNRFSKIVIDNPYQAPPQVICVEQEVIALGDGRNVLTDAGNLNFPFDPNEAFPLLNPLTGEEVGSTVMGAQAHAIIWSYVMHEAKKRDDAKAAALLAQSQQADPSPSAP